MGNEDKFLKFTYTNFNLRHSPYFPLPLRDLFIFRTSDHEAFFHHTNIP